jgi:hyperosmotically inducible protein
MLAATVVALSACAGDPTPRATAQYNDDASINTNVQAAVVGVPGIHANNIQVSTYEAVVKLRGTADTTLAARNAVQAARQVAGVKKVDYDIKVAPQ